MEEKRVFDLKKILDDSRRLERLNVTVWNSGKNSSVSDSELKSAVDEVARIAVESESQRLRMTANRYLEGFQSHSNPSVYLSAGESFKPFKKQLEGQIRVLKSLHNEVMGASKPSSELIEKMRESIEKSDFLQLKLLGVEYLRTICDTHSDEETKKKAERVFERVKSIV